MSSIIPMADRLLELVLHFFYNFQTCEWFLKVQCGRLDMIKVETKPGMEDSEDQVTVLFIYSHNAQRHRLMMFFLSYFVIYNFSVVNLCLDQRG